MSRDTTMKILGAIGAIGAGVAGGMAAGPTGAIVGGVVGLVQFLAGAFHSQLGSVFDLINAINIHKKDGK